MKYPPFHLYRFLVFLVCFFFYVGRALRVVGTGAPLFVTSSKDSQRHLRRLSVNISRGSNAKLCQIYRDRRNSDNNALAFKSLSRPFTTARLPAPACDRPNSGRSFLCHYITDISCKNKSNVFNARTLRGTGKAGNVFAACFAPPTQN